MIGKRQFRQSIFNQWKCSSSEVIRPRGLYVVRATSTGEDRPECLIRPATKQIMQLLHLSVLTLAVVVMAAPRQSRFVFGPMYGWRYPLVQSHIEFAETTLCPGKTPSPEIPRASLWLGMEVPNERSQLKTDLIQGIVVSDPGVYRRYSSALNLD
jgi:hypothetical protein